MENQYIPYNLIGRLTAKTVTSKNVLKKSPSSASITESMIKLIKSSEDR